MRKPIGVMLGVCLVGIVAVVIAAAGSERRDAFSLGVIPGGPVAKLATGNQVCQGPISIPDGAADFDRVAVVIGTYGKRGSEVAVSIEPVGGGKAFGSGRVAAGYSDVVTTPTHSVAVGHVETRAPFDVCIRNAGPNPVGIYGNGDPSARTSTATLDGQPTNADLALTFEHAHPRSALSLLGPILGRASLWRASWTGEWFSFLLVLAVIAGVPALLVVALRSATRE
jgi:hypothetical protein